MPVCEAPVTWLCARGAVTAGVTLCLVARLGAWGPTEWPADGSCTQALNLLGEFRASGTGGKTGKAQLKLKWAWHRGTQPTAVFWSPAAKQGQFLTEPSKSHSQMKGAGFLCSFLGVCGGGVRRLQTCRVGHPSPSGGQGDTEVVQEAPHESHVPAALMRPCV